MRSRRSQSERIMSRWGRVLGANPEGTPKGRSGTLYLGGGGRHSMERLNGAHSPTSEVEREPKLG
jgi:hypothetical protein